MKATKTEVDLRETNRIMNLYDRAARDYKHAVKAKDTNAAKKLKKKMLDYDKQLAEYGEEKLARART